MIHSSPAISTAWMASCIATWKPLTGTGIGDRRAVLRSAVEAGHIRVTR